MRKTLLIASHLLALGLGFGLGIYALPVLVAPQAPSLDDLAARMGPALWTGHFRRDLKDSDALHWGEGVVSVGPRSITLAAAWRRGPTTSSTCRPSSSRPRRTSSA